MKLSVKHLLLAALAVTALVCVLELETPPSLPETAVPGRSAAAAASPETSSAPLAVPARNARDFTYDIRTVASDRPTSVAASMAGEVLPEIRMAPGTLPVVLVEPTGLDLDQRELKALENMRANFVAYVGVESDPNDPAYAARWKTAKPVFDQQVRAVLGYQVFHRLSMAAAAQR